MINVEIKVRLTCESFKFIVNVQEMAGEEEREGGP
jgi:hypothetical protein